jgi:hypothetical protein
MEKKEKGHKRLTIAELRNCKGFENYSDEQSEETIRSLEKLSILFYELYMKQKQNEGNYSFNKKAIVNEKTNEKLIAKSELKKRGGKNEGKADQKKRNAA